MNPEITTINIQYQSNILTGVQVYYNGYDTENSISIGGYVSLSVEEYEGNESLSVLSELVRSKIIEKLSEVQAEEAPPLTEE